MMLNSFITKVGEKGHHENVTPFKFHSETQMQNKSKKLIDNFFIPKREANQSLIEVVKWNFLLVDDQCR